MATDIEKLVVQLSADFKKLENGVSRGRAAADKQFKAIEARAMQLDKRLAGAFDNTGKRIAAAFAAGITLNAVKDLIDSAVKIQNQLKQTGLAGVDLKKVYDQLFASAQRNGAPIEALVTLYSRASSAAEDLHASQAELISFSDGVAIALRASGQSAEESAGALLQLSQALGGAKIQSEEYNSLIDGGRPILQAVANGLKEAGGSIGKLTQLVKAGKVPAEAFFKAFLAGKSTLENSVAGAETTVSQSLQRIRNALIDAAGKFNEGTRSSELFGRAATQIAAEINSINFDKIVEQIGYIISALNRATSGFGSMLDAAGRASGLQSFANNLISKLPGDTTVKDIFAGTPLAGSLVITPQDAVQSRIDDAFSLPENTRNSLTPEQIQAFAAPKTNAVVPKGGRLPADTSTVSLKDFPLPPSSSTGSKSKTDDFKREVDSINQRTTALKETYDAQSKLNPLDADYAQKVTAVEQATSALSAAQKAGSAVGKQLSDVNQLLYGDLTKLTPEAQKQAEAIRAAALGYADADAKLNKLKETQDAAAQSLKDMLDLEKDVAGGILTDIRSALEDGKITWKEWGGVAVNALNKVADKLQEMLIDQLFSKGSSGLLGLLFGGVAGGSVGGGIAGAGGAAAIPSSSAAGMMRAPRMPNIAPAKAQSVHVTVGLRGDGLNIEPEVVSVTRGEIGRTVPSMVKGGWDRIKKNELHGAINDHLARPRRRG